MRVFVTGGTGFLGRRVIARLRDEGHEIVCLTRDASALAATAGVEPVEGDLENADYSVLTGCDAVIHLASLVGVWAPWSRYRRVVVESTARLAEAAAAHGVRRFVYVSSEAVMQNGRPLVDIDESTPVPARQSSRYGRAKREAERRLLDISGLETVILRPPFIWGPHSPMVNDFVAMARSGKLPFVDDGRAGFEHIHVDNLAAVTCAALTRGEPGGTYFVTNDEPMSCREFFTGLLAAHDAPVPTRSMPGWLLRPAATAIEALWNVVPWGSPPLTPFEVEFLSLPRRYRIDAARRELGYQPRVTFAQGLETLNAAADGVFGGAR